jgi:hypothetical protein
VDVVDDARGIGGQPGALGAGVVSAPGPGAPTPAGPGPATTGPSRATSPGALPCATRAQSFSIDDHIASTTVRGRYFGSHAVPNAARVMSRSRFGAHTAHRTLTEPPDRQSEQRRRDNQEPDAAAGAAVVELTDATETADDAERDPPRRAQVSTT